METNCPNCDVKLFSLYIRKNNTFKHLSESYFCIDCNLVFIKKLVVVNALKEKL